MGRNHVIIERTFEQEVEEAQGLRYERQYDATKSLSAINRQLAMTGGGIVWMFRNGTGIADSTKDNLLWALLFFVIAIMVDYMYYYITYAIYKRYSQRNKLVKVEIKTNEKGEKYEKKEINPIPKFYHKMTLCIWYLRLAFVVAGYLVVLCSILQVKTMV